MNTIEVEDENMVKRMFGKFSLNIVKAIFDSEWWTFFKVILKDSSVLDRMSASIKYFFDILDLKKTNFIELSQ